MKRFGKAILILAAVFVCVGAILFVAALASAGWDFTALDTDRLEERIYTAEGGFENISIGVRTDDVTFALAEDGTCRVVCLEREKETHTVTVKDGTLSVETVYEGGIFGDFGIHFRSPSVTVYLPENAFASLTLKASTGDVSIPAEFSFASADITITTGGVRVFAAVSGDLAIAATTGDVLVESTTLGSLDATVTTGDVTVQGTAVAGDLSLAVTTGDATVKNTTVAGDFSLEVSTGDGWLTDVTCKNFRSDGSTGYLALTRLVAEEKITVERSTGDVCFDHADAAGISVKTTTGDVTGSFLTEKIVYAETTTGEVSVPRSTSGGRCDITTTTGDVRIDG